MTDDALALMRGDHELRGATVRACAEKFGIDCDRARRLLYYQNRAHIDPR